MVDRAEIEQPFIEDHAHLTRIYYADPFNYAGGKKAFDIEHRKIWTDMEEALRLAGYTTEDALESRLSALEDRLTALEQP